jgi:hypothetical protein
MAQEVQTLDARYIDGAALLALLKRLFGNGKFSIDVCTLGSLTLPANAERSILMTHTPCESRGNSQTYLTYSNIDN